MILLHGLIQNNQKTPKSYSDPTKNIVRLSNVIEMYQQTAASDLTLAKKRKNIILSSEI